MFVNPLRQAIFGLLLLMMGAVLWATAWAKELETRVRLGEPTQVPSLFLRLP